MAEPNTGWKGTKPPMLGTQGQCAPLPKGHLFKGAEHRWPCTPTLGQEATRQARGRPQEAHPVLSDGSDHRKKGCWENQGRGAAPIKPEG